VRLVPSIADFLFILIAATVVLLMGERLLLDADAGWHVRTGDWILAHRAFVRDDIFSYRKYGEPWVAWEWLYDVALSLANRLGGLRGVVLLSGVVLAATFRKLLDTLLARKTNFYAALFLTILVFGAVAIHALARPHLVSWYFTLTLYVLLDDFQRGILPAKKLFLVATPLMVLWVNLHGGFVIGLAVSAAFVVANAWDRAREKLNVTAGVFFALGAASFCSPYGYRLHVAVYHFIANPTLMETIEEFRSPNFHMTTAKFLVAILVVCVVAPAFSKLRFATHEVLVLALSVYVALLAARGIPSSALLMALIVAPHVSAWFDGFPALKERSLHHLALRERLKSPVAMLATVVLLGALAARGVTVARFPEERFPIAGARDYLRAHPEVDHVLSPDFYAGYLIYYLYPHLRLAMDSRFDFLGEAYAREYEAVARAHPGWNAILDRWNVRYVLFPVQSSLASTMKVNRGWKVLFEDAGAVIFARTQYSHP
jgi:hypothetical protein